MFEKLCALKNKKGFTLIEMLVVIAIIAVLVAIVVPVVTGSSKKASAAADAANLRSAEASVAILVINGELDADTYTAADLASHGIDIPANAKSDNSLEFKCVVADDGQITVTYGDKTINDFAEVAGGESSSSTPSGT